MNVCIAVVVYSGRRISQNKSVAGRVADVVNVQVNPVYNVELVKRFLQNSTITGSTVVILNSGVVALRTDRHPLPQQVYLSVLYLTAQCAITCNLVLAWKDISFE